MSDLYKSACDVCGQFDTHASGCSRGGPKRVPEMLREAADIYQQRNAIYGDNYKHAGEVLLGLFPRGVVIQTAEEFNRFHLINHMLGKLSRYCQNLKNGGHADSLDDLSVYAMMARECDREDKDKRTTPEFKVTVVPSYPPKGDHIWKGGFHFTPEGGDR